MKKKLLAGLAVGIMILWAVQISNATSFVNAPSGSPGTEPSFSPGPYSLGLYFDVVSPIQVTALGAFDSLSDGVFLSNTEVGIFDRDTHSLVSPIVTFSTGNTGNADGGFTYINLTTPVILEAGFKGVVAAAGYSGVNTSYEPYGDYAWGDVGTSFNDGGGLLNSLGGFSYIPGATVIYPSNYLGSNPVPEFAAPSFQYGAVPEPATMLLMGTGLAGLVGARRKKKKQSTEPRSVKKQIPISNAPARAKHGETTAKYASFPPPSAYIRWQ